MKLKGKNIILISPEPWGVNFLSKHHYAIELAKRGNKVWFINPPGKNWKVSTIVENLFSVTYPPFIRGKNIMPEFFSRWLHKIEIERIKRVAGKPDLVWSFDPFRFQWLRDFEASYKIFHPVDEMKGADRIGIISCQANVVLSTAKKILEPLKKFNGRCYVIPHGCHFEDETKLTKPVLLPGKNKIKATYVGNFYSVLDLNAIKMVVSENPEVDFIFIGPLGNSNLGKALYDKEEMGEIQKMNNTYFLREVTPADLNNYLANSDIDFVVYKTPQLNPHKLMGYFFSGKVVIATKIEEYKGSNLIEMAKDPNDFLEVFRMVKENLSFYNSKEKQKERRFWALQHTYPKLIEKIERIINEP